MRALEGPARLLWATTQAVAPWLPQARVLRARPSQLWAHGAAQAYVQRLSSGDIRSGQRGRARGRASCSQERFVASAVPGSSGGLWGSSS